MGYVSEIYTKLQQKGNDIMTNYQYAYIYSKKGNLEDYLKTDKTLARYNYAPSEPAQRYYTNPREIRLILLIRNDYANRKMYCRIKCPVNPLPVKGEFEVPSLASLRHFLEKDGWMQKEYIHAHLLR